nr:Hypothetical protein [Providencia alcalifaciens]
MMHNYIIGIVALALSSVVNSATVNLTAKFTPAINNSNSDGIFINTTPSSGFCKIHPKNCQGDAVSVHVPLSTTISYPIVANNEPREGVYFNFPKTPRTLTVRNQDTGESFDVIFRVTYFSSKAKTNPDRYEWDEGGKDLSAPRGGGCSFYTSSWSNDDFNEFIWATTNNTLPCYKISRIYRTEPSTFSDMSIGYSLVAQDNLLTIGSGTYVGTLSFTVGPGGDFDFGDNYQANDSVVDVNLILSVNHDLIITTTPESRVLSLQPCGASKVCTEEQGRQNWERWMVSRVTPEMTAKSNFQLSSSGAFTVYLQCEYEKGENCALKSDKNEQLVPIHSYLTLPDNVVSQQTNNLVIREPMSIRKDFSNIFLSKNLGTNRKGSIDFLVNQRDVDTMLLTRPDTYRGVVTVIFDPNIYGI